MSMKDQCLAGLAAIGPGADAEDEPAPAPAPEPPPELANARPSVIIMQSTTRNINFWKFASCAAEMITDFFDVVKVKRRAMIAAGAKMHSMNLLNGLTESELVEILKEDFLEADKNRTEHVTEAELKRIISSIPQLELKGELHSEGLVDCLYDELRRIERASPAKLDVAYDAYAAACAPGARREDFARVDGKTRGVACVHTMSRSASVLPSPVAPLGPHMHHMTGRVAESPGRASGGPSQFRTGPSDDATGPDRQSGLRSPAAGGARPRRVWRSTPTDEGVRRRERFWGTEDPCAAKLFRAETTETRPPAS